MNEKPHKSAPARKPSRARNAPVNEDESGAPLEAIGYIRVSTNEQADSGLSLIAQRQRIEAQAAANGWKLLAVYEDAGVSAKTLERPGLKAALAKLRPGRVLLAMKLDRLTRSVRDLYDLVQTIEASGAEWGTIQDRFDTTTPTGRLMLGIIVQLSQWERETIADRTQTALAVKKERRERLGTTPLGFQTVRDEGGVAHLEADPEEAETVRIARELRAGGMSLRRIAAILTSSGRKTKRGGKWEAQTVAKIVAPRYVESLARANDSKATRPRAEDCALDSF